MIPRMLQTQQFLRNQAGWLPVWAVLALALPVAGETAELNLYSARKENLIRPLLDRFTAESGIRVNVLAAGGSGLVQRLRG